MGGDEGNDGEEASGTQGRQPPLLISWRTVTGPAMLILEATVIGMFAALIRYLVQ